MQLDNAKGELFPGAYAEVHFKLPGSAETLRLPANTVLFRAAGLQVATLDAQQPGVKLKSIVQGRDFGNTIEVLSGSVRRTMTVVLNPPDSIADGVRCGSPQPAADGPQERQGDVKRMRQSSSTMAHRAAGVIGCCRCRAVPSRRHTKTPAAPPPREAYKECRRLEDSRSRPIRQSRGAWWTLFQDPELDALEDQGQRMPIRISRRPLRGCSRRAPQTRIARADLFPDAHRRIRRGRDRALRVNSPQLSAGTEPTGNNFVLEADLSYEIDVWGRVRNHGGIRQGEPAGERGRSGGAESATHAELATDYFTLRSEDTQQQLLDQTVEDYAQGARA